MSQKMQSESPIISVVMSVYNGERFLREAVDSILSQTLTDFEFIIVNDGSTDSTWQILREYTAQDARIVLICNEENIGMACSLNKGLALAQGKYIARLDGDDVSLPERLERQVKFLELYPEVGILGTATYAMDDDGHIFTRALWQPSGESGFLRWRLCFENPIVHPTVMMRREVVAQTDGYHAAMENSEDYDLWQRLSGMTRLSNLPEVLLYRRRHGDAMSQQYADVQYQNSLKISQQMMLEILGEEVPFRLIKKVIKHFGKPKFETLDDVCEAAQLIYRLCQACVMDSTLSRREKFLVRKDAAQELYLLFRPRLTDLRAWKMLGWACRLDPSIVARVSTGKTRRRLVRFINSWPSI